VTARLHRERGGKLYREGRFEEAAARYTQALQHTPDDPTLLANRSVAVLNAGRPHDALVDAQVSHCSQLSPLRKIIARHSL
jgi:Flp pilus assembly protein TadD